MNKELSMHDVFNTVKKLGYPITSFDNNLLVDIPGKFQGEHVSTLYFWDSMIKGKGEEMAGTIYFSMTEEERKLFGFSPGFNVFAIYETSDGFVSGYAQEWIPSVLAAVSK